MEEKTQEEIKETIEEKKRILIVDDEPLVLQTLKVMLEKDGYEVIMARDGKEALLAISKKPDLILCDIMMPGMDGYAVCRHLQGNPKTRKIPFIFLTAKVQEEDRLKGYSLGAHKYLTKPTSKKDLLNAVNLRLRQSERAQALFDRIHKSYSGNLKDVSLASLVELFYVGKWDGEIILERTELDSEKRVSGWISFKEGTFFEATTEGFKDRDAFRLLLEWNEGSFTLTRM